MSWFGVIAGSALFLAIVFNRSFARLIADSVFEYRLRLKWRESVYQYPEADSWKRCQETARERRDRKARELKP